VTLKVSIALATSSLTRLAR